MSNQEDYFNRLTKDESLSNLQKYLKNILKIRGFDGQSIELKLVLLIEEVGELAKSIRKENIDLAIDKNKLNNYSSVEEELADVFIVLLSIANKLNIDMYDVFIKKEKENIYRKWEK